MTVGEDPGARTVSSNTVRVLVFHRMGPDTFLVYEGGEVSLVDRATLVSLLKQLRKERS